jgi:hypothetical protein
VGASQLLSVRDVVSYAARIGSDFHLMSDYTNQMTSVHVETQHRIYRAGSGPWSHSVASLALVTANRGMPR